MGIVALRAVGIVFARPMNGVRGSTTAMDSMAEGKTVMA
jgi:hypothetical protein